MTLTTYDFRHVCCRICAINQLGLYCIHCSLVVRASDLRLNGCEFHPRLRTIGWMVLVTVFGRAYHLGM